MYKVLLVDDEPLAIEYLLKVVDWQELGFSVCGTAEDGSEAIEIMENCIPDVIISDMIMPIMDGIELTKMVKKSGRDIDIVIITGSDELDYARKSIKLDVKDYLLKPFDIEELRQVLVGIKLENDKKKERLRERKKSVIYNLLTNPVDENINNVMMYFDKNSNYQLSLVYCDTNDKRKELIFDLRNSFLNDSDLFFIKEGEQRIVCIYKSKLKDALLDILNEQLNDEFLFTKPVECNQITQFYESYQMILGTINDAVISSKKGMVEPYDNQKSSHAVDLHEKLNKFSKLIKLKQKDEVLYELKQIYSLLEKSSYSDVFYVSKTIIGFYQDLCDDHDFDFSEQNIKNKSMNEIEEYMIESTAFVLNQDEKKLSSRSVIVAKNCINLIDESYSDPELSIGMIGQKLHLDTSYIRRVFKSEIGDTINNYIIQKRIEIAKELIAEKMYKHSEIAKMVGYTDAAYFSKSFKKYVGVSPRDYENLN